MTISQLHRRALEDGQPTDGLRKEYRWLKEREARDRQARWDEEILIVAERENVTVPVARQLLRDERRARARRNADFLRTSAASIPIEVVARFRERYQAGDFDAAQDLLREIEAARA